MNQWTDEEKKSINATIFGVCKTLDHNQVPRDIGAAALMMLCARMVAKSTSSIDQLAESFKNCILDARARELPPQ